MSIKKQINMKEELERLDESIRKMLSERVSDEQLEQTINKIQQIVKVTKVFGKNNKNVPAVAVQTTAYLAEMYMGRLLDDVRALVDAYGDNIQKTVLTLSQYDLEQANIAYQDRRVKTILNTMNQVGLAFRSTVMEQEKETKGLPELIRNMPDPSSRRKPPAEPPKQTPTPEKTEKARNPNPRRTTPTMVEPRGKGARRAAKTMPEIPIREILDQYLKENK